jgi:hypothetical protein
VANEEEIGASQVEEPGPSHSPVETKLNLVSLDHRQRHCHGHFNSIQSVAS